MAGWSVFAVASDKRERVAEACRRALVQFDDTIDNMTLILGEPDPSGYVPFTIKIREDGYAELLDDTEFEIAAELSRALGDLWSLYGDSNTDSCEVYHYQRGRRVLLESTIRSLLQRFSDQSGFDLDALSQWAEFGISGGAPAGTCYPLCVEGGDGEDDV